MKTSQILCSLLILGAFAGNACATNVNEVDECYSTNQSGIDYVVYFENARPRPNEANMTYRGLNQTTKANCINDLESTLGSLRAASENNCIVLLGTADKKNDKQQGFNTELSIRRVEMVYKMLTSAIQNNDCIRAFAGGASNSYFRENTQHGDDYKERVVRIIVTKKDTPINEQDITLNITNNITNNTQNTMTSITSVVLDNSQAVANQKRIDIVSIVSDLKNMNNSFGRSHWKTASGNFNGARLASDSIAGVVLGTTGGLITSNIIKKNQIRSGFEDLQCVIAGQVVADYNDEFTTRINWQQ